jgi:hypothetical protein
MTRSRLCLLLVTSALLLTVAACGGNDDKSSDLPTTPPSSSSTPSTAPSSIVPTSTPSPTVEPTQTITKYGQLTLVFNQPATVDAKARPAMKAYRVFQQIFRGMLGTSTDDPLLKTVAGPSAVTYVQGVLQNQVKDGDKLGGTLTVTAKVEQVGQAIVLLGGCFDQSKSYGIRPNGTHYVAEVVKKKPTLHVTAIASPGAAGWQITDYRLKSGAC